MLRLLVAALLSLVLPIAVIAADRPVNHPLPIFEKERGLEWAGRTFTSKAQLTSFLHARGASYDVWVERHPGAAPWERRARWRDVLAGWVLGTVLALVIVGRPWSPDASTGGQQGGITSGVPPPRNGRRSQASGSESAASRGTSHRRPGSVQELQHRAPPDPREFYRARGSVALNDAVRRPSALAGEGTGAALRRHELPPAQAVRDWRPGVAALLVLVAAVLWFGSLRSVRLSDLTDHGLVSALPLGCFVALFLLTGVFTWLLSDASRHRVLLAASLATFIVMIYGAPAVIAEAARFPVTWRHAGVVEYISRMGSVDPGIDAYFNWPGFFILGSFVTETAHLDLLRIANWFPAFLNVLYAIPLWVIFARFTEDSRTRWLALWFFFLGNWVAQDYVSPQGLAFFIYLATCAGVLTAFTRGNSIQHLLARIGTRLLRRPISNNDEASAPSPFTAHQRVGIIVIIVVSFAAVSSGHQLTPYAITVAAAALVIVGASSTRLLPLLMIMIIGLWSAFMAVAYFKGHFSTLLNNVGQGAVESNVSSRLGGSPGHMTVVHARLALTMAVWSLAGLGTVLAARRREPIVPLVVLAAAAFLLVPLQPYGGEMLMRVYLFSLPFTALLAASVFAVRESGRRLQVATMAAATTVVVLTGTFLLARYGNERMDQFTRAEVAAVEAVYDQAPPGSRIVAATRSLPWKLRDYEKHRYLVLQDWWSLSGGDEAAAKLVRSLAADLLEDERPAYVILSRSQEAEGDIMGAAEVGFIRRLDTALRASPKFEVVSRSTDASVFVFAPPIN